MCSESSTGNFAKSPGRLCEGSYATFVCRLIWTISTLGWLMQYTAFFEEWLSPQLIHPQQGSQIRLNVISGDNQTFGIPTLIFLKSQNLFLRSSRNIFERIVCLHKINDGHRGSPLKLNICVFNQRFFVISTTLDWKYSTRDSSFVNRNQFDVGKTQNRCDVPVFNDISEFRTCSFKCFQMFLLATKCIPKLQETRLESFSQLMNARGYSLSSVTNPSYRPFQGSLKEISNQY